VVSSALSQSYYSDAQGFDMETLVLEAEKAATLISQKVGGEARTTYNVKTYNIKYN
jgi:hypothetical protein